MCRVSKNARIADVAAYCLCAATPLPFVYLHFADIVDAALPATLFRYLWQIGVTACYPSGRLMHLVVWIFVDHFCQGSMVGDRHACSLVHWLNPSGSFSFISYRHYAVSACGLLLFHFYFNLGVILIYSPRSYEAGAFLSFGPAWTAYGLGQ